MTVAQQKQIIAINRRIRKYRKVLDEAITSGAKSASLSTGGNSQSYTRYSLDDITKMISALEMQKRAILGRGAARRIAPDFE
jgi:hypothetical protein